MIQARRRQMSDHLVEGEVVVTLVAADISVTVGWGGAGVGFIYRRPVAVDCDGRRVAIRDHTMMARMAAAAVVALTAITRWMR